MRIDYNKKDNKIKFMLSRKDNEKNVLDVLTLRTKYLKYLIYGRTKNYKAIRPKNIWFITEHGYSFSTVNKNIDNDDYYNKVSNLDTFVEFCDSKITPVEVVSCAALILENFKAIRKKKGDIEAKEGSDVIRPNYRLLSMEILFFYN